VAPMPTIVDKSAVTDLLRDEFAAMTDLCWSLTDTQWDQPTCLPGWTVHDVLSHVIGTEAMLLGVPAPPADVSHLGHMRNPVAEANEVWVESMRPLTGDALRARFADVTGRRMVALEAMSQADFDAPSWTPAGRDETYGRFMRIRHYDCFMHENDIRDAVGQSPRADQPDLRSAMDEVATGLGYIVGRRAALPQGSRVRIDLTGLPGCTYLVQVDDRATVVDHFDDDPTIGLEMPLSLFLRLTGGRHDRGPGHGEQVVITGDRTLGEQLVANLAFTI
jgi:uncharacterized protein (TIGR03083 family)